jgi:hypothetical protein
MRPYPILTLGWATLLVGGLAIQRHFQERDAWPASADLGHPAVSARAVRLELGYESQTRAPSEAEALLGAADTFFRSVAFSP